MKRITKVLPIYAALSLMLFSSCCLPAPNYDVVTSIEIRDNHNKYALGENFKEENELVIKAVFSKSGEKTLTLDELGYTCTYIEEGVIKNYSLENEFTAIGTYTLSLNKDGVTSNSINFEVITEHVFVSDITITGNNHMDRYQETVLTVNVIPSNYTTSLEFEYPEDVEVDIHSHTLTVYPKGLEDFDIKVTTDRSKTEEISYTFDVTMNESAPIVDPKQDYHLLKSHSPYTINSCPISGSPRLLVIPVWFSNSDDYIPKTYKENILKDIELAYFGSEEEIGWHSVSSYYKAESFGKLNLRGTVSEWYNSGYNTSYINRDSMHTENLVIKAVNWYFTNHTEDSRSNYDYDNDGFMDGVVVIYAAPDYRTSGQYQNTNLWAYTYWLQESARSGTVIPNAFFWASYDFMYGYNTVEERTGGDYPGGDTSHCKVDTHTFIHEMGHVFGLDDYYDYADSNPRSPAASFSMQDYNVGGHDPFSVFSFDWAKAYKPTTSAEIIIGDFQSTHDLILLTPSWNSKNSPFDEYLLLELYSTNGLNEMDCKYAYRGNYPRGADIVGIRLWHVDARLVRGLYPSAVFYTDASLASVQTGLSNSSSGRAPAAGSAYFDYNLLQLIRRDVTQDYKSTKPLANDDLFVQGDSFDIDTYASQFVKRVDDKVTLNSGKELGWSFTVSQIYQRNSKSYAKIILTKE